MANQLFSPKQVNYLAQFSVVFVLAVVASSVSTPGLAQSPAAISAPLQTVTTAEHPTLEAAQAFLKLGDTHARAGDYQRAVPLYYEGIGILQGLADADANADRARKSKSEMAGEATAFEVTEFKPTGVESTSLETTGKPSIAQAGEANSAVPVELLALLQQANQAVAQADYALAEATYRQVVELVEGLGERQALQPNVSKLLAQVPSEAMAQPTAAVVNADVVNAATNSEIAEDVQPKVSAELVTPTQAADLPERDLPEGELSPIEDRSNLAELTPALAQATNPSALVAPSSDEIGWMTIDQAKEKIGFYRQIWVDAKAGKTPITIANAGLNLGQIYLKAQNFKEAQKIFDEVINIIPDGNPAEKASALIGKAYALFGQQIAKPAEDAIQQAEMLLQGVTDHASKARIQLKLGDGYVVLGAMEARFYTKASTLLQQAQRTFTELNQPEQVASAQLRLANLYYIQEKYSDALVQYKAVQAVFEQLGDRPRQIRAWLNLGQIYLEDPACYENENVNCYTEARTAFRTVLDLLGEKIPDEESQDLLIRAKATLGLSDAYLALALQDSENYEQAIAYAQHAQDLFKQLTEQERKARRANVDLFAREIRQTETNISDAHLNQGQYGDAFKILERSQTAAQQIDARLGNLPRIIKTIRGITTFARFVPIPILQQVMWTVNSLAAIADDAITVVRDSQYVIGQVNAYLSQSRIKEAIEQAERARNDAKASGNHPDEAKAWIALGKQQLTIARYKDATASFRSALVVTNLITDLPLQASLQAEAHLGLADSAYAQGETGEAQAAAEQARMLSQSQANRQGEANALMTLGKIALGTGQFKTAQSHAQAAEGIFEAIAETSSTPSSDTAVVPDGPTAQDTRNARLGRAESLLIVSAAELNLGELEAAQKNAIAARRLFQLLGDRIGEGNATLALANASEGLGQYPKAMQDATRALALFRNLGDRAGEANALTALGNVLSVQKQNEQAIRSYVLSQKIETALLAETNPDPGFLVKIPRYGLRLINQILNVLPSSASDFVWKATGVVETVRGALDVAEGSGVSVRLGDAYLNMGEPEKARQSLSAARKAAKQQANPTQEAAAWLGLSNMELSFFNNPESALSNAQEALKLYHKTRNTSGQAYAFLAQGAAYLQQSQKSSDAALRAKLLQQSLVATQVALALLKQSEDKPGAARALRQLGDIYAPARPVETDPNVRVAIAFYKESINLTEAIRQQSIRQRRYQVSYLGTVSETYRRLAALLLVTNQLSSAQRVLDLLKIQELEEYGVRASVDRSGNITYSDLENCIRQQNDNSLIKLGEAVERCDGQCSDLVSLAKDLDALVVQEFSAPLERIKAELTTLELENRLFADPTNLDVKAARLIDPCLEYRQQERPCPDVIAPKQLRTALVYPLIRDKELWLLWVGPGKLAHRFQVDLDAATLRETVSQFYGLLRDRNSTIAARRAAANQLYQWLIRPLEQEIKAGQINNLIFIQDRFLNYIPMAALIDDNDKYLIQRFSVSSVVRPEDTEVATRLPSTATAFQVLAMGQAAGDGGQQPLEHVKTELEKIVTVTGSGNSKLVFGPDFTFSSLQMSLRNSSFRVLHIATHGSFAPDRPDDSYLRLGDGNRLNVPKIRQLKDLAHIHLVVLSACETGLGQAGQKANFSQDGKQPNAGVEIPALSFAFTNVIDNTPRAKSVMASLWPVNDCTTAELMRLFYTNAAQTQKFTKAEALRQAQLAMIQAGKQKSCAIRTSVVVTAPPDPNDASLLRDLSHPYYWAPFILMGNGF
jgi:CHAT domain-containing protein/tetratricopeptide (TPR) repeat protein